MSLTKAKAVAKNPDAYPTELLDDALTVIVDSPDLTEAQVTRLQARIDPVLRARLAAAAGIEPVWTVLLTTPDGVPIVREVLTATLAYDMADDLFDAHAMTGMDQAGSHATFQVWAVAPDGTLIYHDGLDDGHELTAREGR